MIRTQIQLTEQQVRRLKDRAHSEGVSMAEVIRRCVDRTLEQEQVSRNELYRRAATLIGAFHDCESATDVSVNHDKYLDEAYRSEE